MSHSEHGGGTESTENATVDAAALELITLTVALQDANPLAEPDKNRRIETTITYVRDMTFEHPPHIVAVVEIAAA